MVHEVGEHGRSDAAPPRPGDRVHRLQLAVPIADPLQRTDGQQLAVHAVPDEEDVGVHQRVDVERVHVLGRAVLRGEGQVRLEHASGFTGSSFRYNSVFLDAAAYRPIRSRSVLAAHARLGFVRALESTRLATRAGVDVSGDILHPRTRLYAGGARSVRGVGENQLGPRVLTLPPSKLGVICPDLSGDDIASCDLSRTDTSGSGLADRDFTPRPLGGRALLEGSVEFRFPIWQNLYGAAFVDGALLGQGSLESTTKGAGAVTPGIGVRYRSAVGPIRVDLGLNPTLSEDLPVITQVQGPDGQFRIVQLRDQWRYNPTGGSSGITGILRRLTLHLSIGEAY